MEIFVSFMYLLFKKVFVAIITTINISTTTTIIINVNGLPSLFSPSSATVSAVSSAIPNFLFLFLLFHWLHVFVIVLAIMYVFNDLTAVMRKQPTPAASDINDTYERRGRAKGW